MVEEIFIQYSVGRDLAHRWISSNNFIYLLDGLDEVAADARDDCVNIINEFRSDQYNTIEMVVCSRIADYEALSQRLNLNTAIQIQPLGEKQVDIVLQQSGLEMQAVRAMLKTDPPLRELTQSLLLITVMMLAYEGKTIADLKQLKTADTRRRHLFDTYIDAMFTRRPVSTNYPYSELDSRHWLIEIAYGLIEHQASEFYIEKLQPDWLPVGKPRDLYTNYFGRFVELISVLIFAPIFWLIFRFSLRAQIELAVELFSGLFLFRTLYLEFLILLNLSLLFGLWIGAFFRSRIDTGKIVLVEKLQWHPPHNTFNTMSKFLKFGLKFGLIFGLGFGLLGLFGGLIFGLFGRPIGSLDEMLKAALEGVLFSTLLSVLLIMFAGPIFFITKQESLQKSRPNEGVRSSLINALRMCILSGLIFGLAFFFSMGLLETLTGRQDVKWVEIKFFGLILGQIFGLVIGIEGYGGIIFLQHYCLRWLLSRQNILPYPFSDKMLIAYLDAMVARILLRRSGHGYVFIHRSLMEHFAAKHPSQVNN